MIRKWALFVALWSLAQAPAALPQGIASAGEAPARLYFEYCSVCHGEKGDGKSRAAGNLVPRPRDFTAPQAAGELTRPRLIHSIREGRPGTAMVAWKTQLTDRQIAALADFLRDRFMVPTAYDTSNEGRRVYAEYCSVCHGDKGNGVSRASPTMIPPPRDFTASRARQELTRDRMLFSITYGRANTAMAPWETQLSRPQIAAVVGYIRTTFMNPGPGGDSDRGDHGAVTHGGHEAKAADLAAGHQHATPGGDPVAYFSAPFPGGLQGRLDAGEGLYRPNCVPCHGEKGDGNGPRAFFILPRPRDFNHPAARASLNRPHLFEAISKGTLRSEMPAWETVLSPQQIADVAEYMLKAFIRPPKGGALPAPHDHSGHLHATQPSR